MTKDFQINFIDSLPSYFINKGVSLEELGNHDEAQPLFEKAKQLDPTYQGEFIVGEHRLSKPLPSPI